MAADEPVHVGGGGFRLDPKLALQKLQRYQLKDATGFLQCWIRAAVSLEPTELTVSLEEGLRVSFDARLPEAWLAHPFDSLLISKAPPAERYLGQGVLGALGAGADSVVASSGYNVLTVTSGPETTLSTVSQLRPDAELVARPAGPAGLRTLQRAVEALHRSCGLAGCRIVVDGRTLPDVSPAGFSARYTGAGLTGRAGDPGGPLGPPDAPPLPPRRAGIRRAVRGSGGAAPARR